MLAQNLQSPDYWINRSVQSSSTSSSASSTLSHGEPKTQPQLQPAASLLADVLAHTRIGRQSRLMSSGDVSGCDGPLFTLLNVSPPPENSVPPDVTSSTPQERGSRVDLPPAVRGMSRGQSRSSMLDTADGTPPTSHMFRNTFTRLHISAHLGSFIGRKSHFSTFDTCCGHCVLLARDLGLHVLITSVPVLH